jgi:S1-C subfamily serine protease
MKASALAATVGTLALVIAPSSGAQSADREGSREQQEAAVQRDIEREAERAQRAGASDQQEAQRQAAQAGQAADRDRSTLERELEHARDQMAEAAREVGRLSAELSAPIIRDVQRQFRYAGQGAMLGVNVEDTDSGVRIRGVSPAGPAADAGLRVGDTIVAIDGADLKPSGASKQSPTETLLRQMANVDPGTDVKLRVLRDGKQRDVAVKAREVDPGQFQFFGWQGRPQGPQGPQGPGLQGLRQLPFVGSWLRMNAWSDMQLATLTPELGGYFGTDKGLLVLRGPGKDALKLRDGDVILDIGGRAPTSPEHALRILGSFEPGEKLMVTVMRKQRRETLTIDIPGDSPG